ncbi:MAG TPA: hypothetical protein VJZ93_03080 [Candidatus Nanoarchaeia archaeon]|nr:hypothetical protein [Candidatus Nanoarchaeia archaeon]
MSRIVQEGNLHFRRVRGRQSSLVVPTHSQIVNGEVDVKEHYDWKEDYVKLPSGIYVSRQGTLLGNYNQVESTLRERIKPSEFVELLRYARENNSDLYNGITEGRSPCPWKSEFIGARFKKKEDGMYMITRDGEEKLDEDTLMEDKTPGISLESWIENPTKQGFPRKNVNKGSLYFWHPRDNSVARFDADSGSADLYCGGNPSDRDLSFGVRAVRRE